MKLKKLLAVLAALGASAAMAQAQLGEVISVEGVATVTQGAAVTNVTVGTPVRDGTRIVTTTGARVTVRLNNGCVVSLSSSQGVTLQQTLSCQELLAAVRPVPVVATVVPVATLPPVVGGGIVNGVVLISAAALALQIARTARDMNRNDPVLSPN